MKGLPETFDMAKRVALILYVPQNTVSAISFDDVFQFFRKDHPKFKRDLSKHRSRCLNRWALNKCRLGLPGKTSRTSFSKYVRVAHGMNLIISEKKYKSWILRPNSSTFVVNILSELSEEKFGASRLFEIPFALKLFFTNNLLARDSVFIIPILKVLKQAEVSSSTGFLARDFLMRCAHELVEFFSSVMEREFLELPESQVFYKRLKFFEKNYLLMVNKCEPTGGFSHMIEPRIHWLIDLALVDFHSFCEEGNIEPARFLSEFLHDPFKADWQERVMSKYFDYLNSLALPKKPVRLRIHTRNSETLEDAANFSVKRLMKYYPRLVPVESVVLLAQVIGSLVMKRFVSKKEISYWLEKNYTISRDWEPSKGFLEIEHAKK